MKANFEALRRAVDFIEANLSSKLPVDAVADASYYSSPHLSWMFRDVTGYGVGEYIRLRRISEAALAIAGGADIQDTALSYGFSSQQVLTPCVRSYFGVTPAKLRTRRDVLGKLIPKLSISDGGETMKLIADYNWRNGEEAADLLRKILTPEALELIGRAVRSSVPKSEATANTVSDLLYIRALREENGNLHVKAPVDLAEDSARMHRAGRLFAESLAEEITASADPAMLDAHPRVRSRADRNRYCHFLTGPVTLGWQGHEMLTRLGRIASRAENTDDQGRWYLLRGFSSSRSSGISNGTTRRYQPDLPPATTRCTSLAWASAVSASGLR